MLSGRGGSESAEISFGGQRAVGRHIRVRGASAEANHRDGIASRSGTDASSELKATVDGLSGAATSLLRRPEVELSEGVTDPFIEDFYRIILDWMAAGCPQCERPNAFHRY